MTFITRTQQIQLQNKQTNNCATETIELALFKSQTKVKTPTNHNWSKKRNEAIRIPNYYLQLTESAGKIARTRCFGFVPHWLKNCRLIFKAITKLSNRNGVVASDSHLKTAVRIGNDPIQQFQSFKYNSTIFDVV